MRTTVQETSTFHAFEANPLGTTTRCSPWRPSREREPDGISKLRRRARTAPRVFASGSARIPVFPPGVALKIPRRHAALAESPLVQHRQRREISGLLAHDSAQFRSKRSTLRRGSRAGPIGLICRPVRHDDHGHCTMTQTRRYSQSRTHMHQPARTSASSPRPQA